MNKFILNFNKLLEVDLNILEFLNKINTKSPIDFYTSGTTGTPKKTTHSYDFIIKNIKINPDYKNHIWGLTYDPNKIAGSQVILQSFLNKGKLVNLFGRPSSEVNHLIKKYNITHISATPTFYRLLEKDTFNQVQQVTFGGEAVSSNLFNKITDLFPNAKLKNIYASTEFGTLFATNKEYFTLSDRLSTFIKIENNTIFVKENNIWHNTEDIVEWVDDSKFKIIGRTTNIINVGGIKVNPIKVESYLNELTEIKNSYVYSKSNSVMGNIVTADIILKKDIDKKTIKHYLKNYLTPYEIPLKFNVVKEIKTNSTGKIIRQ